MADKAKKPKADWEAIEREYRSNKNSLREIGRQFDVSEGAIRKRAKADGWARTGGELVRSAYSPPSDALAASLTDQQERFCQEYLIDLNATQAAIRAGYSEGTAKQQGSRLLTNVAVSARVGELQASLGEIAGMKAVDLMKRLKSVIFADVRELFTDDGKLKNIKDIPDDLAAALSAIDVDEIKIIGGGEDADGNERPAIMSQVKKVKRWDMLKAIELAGRHLGMFKENTAATVNITVTQNIDARVQQVRAEIEEIVKRGRPGSRPAEIAA